MGLLERETVPGVCRASPASQTKPITPDSTDSMISLRFQSEGKAQKWEKEKCTLSLWKLFSQHWDFSWELRPADPQSPWQGCSAGRNFSSCSPSSLPGCCCFCAELYSYRFSDKVLLFPSSVWVTVWNWYDRPKASREICYKFPFRERVASQIAYLLSRGSIFKSY